MLSNLGRSSIALVGLLMCSVCGAQPLLPAGPPTPAPPVVPSDILGRTTPRGSVLGFLKAARKGDDEVAAQYLNTRLRGKAAAVLAHQLFVVLDRRLPARLNELSDQPEGSMPYLTRPDEDLVGTIIHSEGKVDVLLEKLPRDKNIPVWLFSSKTLESIPDIFKEVDAVSVERVLPGFLTQVRIAQIALYDWLAIFLGLPLLYLLICIVNRGLSPWIGRLRRASLKNSTLADPVVLPKPIRLILMALIIRWSLHRIDLPLMARQFWTGMASIMALAACVWLLIVLNGRGERIVQRRLDRVNKTWAKSILSLGRRAIDLLLIFIGVLFGLHHFGISATAALAGLGVGGIAVALAAQKTLENVIGGISILLDQAVSVGDTLNIGNTIGIVEYVGLRSTRIRTLDRTVVSVPNGQLATVQLENISVRDKFWFHPNLSLRYDTTALVMRSILERISGLLMRHSLVDRTSVRARFYRLGVASLDIEVFAYILAHDWIHFLEIQQELLLQVMEIVETAGARIAFPSQTMYLASDSSSEPLAARLVSRPPAKQDTHEAGTTFAEPSLK